jgi:hypothetical protein
MERTRLTPGRPVTADNGEADQAKSHNKGDCVPFPVYITIADRVVYTRIRPVRLPEAGALLRASRCDYERQVVAPAGKLFTMTAWERLQLLVGGFGEEQAERALELLSPLIGADALPGQQVRQLPAFVGIGDSGRSDISEHVDDLLAGGFGE